MCAKCPRCLLLSVCPYQNRAPSENCRFHPERLDGFRAGTAGRKIICPPWPLSVICRPLKIGPGDGRKGIGSGFRSIRSRQGKERPFSLSQGPDAERDGLKRPPPGAVHRFRASPQGLKTGIIISGASPGNGSGAQGLETRMQRIRPAPGTCQQSRERRQRGKRSACCHHSTQKRGPRGSQRAAFILSGLLSNLRDRRPPSVRFKGHREHGRPGVLPPQSWRVVYAVSVSAGPGSGMLSGPSAAPGTPEKRPVRSRSGFRTVTG